MIPYFSKISQKTNADFVMGYTLNLCKIHFSVVPYNQNIKKGNYSEPMSLSYEKRGNRYGTEQSSDCGCSGCVRS